MQAGKHMSRTSLVLVSEASQAAFSVFIEDKKQAEKSNFLVTSYSELWLSVQLWAGKSMKTKSIQLKSAIWNEESYRTHIFISPSFPQVIIALSHWISSLNYNQWAPAKLLELCGITLHSILSLQHSSLAAETQWVIHQGEPPDFQKQLQESLQPNTMQEVWIVS